MDLAKQAKIVDSIHDTLNDFVGQKIKVRANMGRSKIVENVGVLSQDGEPLFGEFIDDTPPEPAPENIKLFHDKEQVLS